MTSPATTPPPPYYAVIFTSCRNEQPDDGYAETFERMYALAQAQPGFLGYESARVDGTGITVSYWKSEEAIAAWKAQDEHVAAQREGRARWYDAYELRVARVDRAYGFARAEA
jgi:heme-degrading monooxygenase HmoA